MKYLYFENHIRDAREGDTVRLGISPVAFKKMKSVMFNPMTALSERIRGE